jgi:(R,R)-butanediol dehydrogenase/meso-butanediol dehydrogenase/diacetyl reductase
MDRMLAVVFKGEGSAVFEERPVPRLERPDDVLVAVEAAGICGTDVHILEVPPGHLARPDVILGHEYTGRVVEVGQGVTTLQPGDRVIVAPSIPCGICRYCRLGRSNKCEGGTALGIYQDGGFARYSRVPERALFKIAPDLPADEAVYGELLSCVMGGTSRVRIQPGESAAILGAGPVGLSFLLFFRAAGARPIIVTDTDPFRRQYAHKLGADLVLGPLEDPVQEQVREATGLGADVVVDAVGSLFPQSIELVTYGGKVVLFGMNEQAVGAIRQNDITFKDITIFGTHLGVNTFPLVIRALERGVLKPSVMTTHRLPLDRFFDGLAAIKARQAVKVVLVP